MATIIKIKRTTTGNAPSGLEQGELAYVYDTSATDNGAGGNGYRLFIGDPTSTSNSAIEIAGKYFTQLLDHTHGTLTASSSVVVDSNKAIDELFIGNSATVGGTLKLNEGTNNGAHFAAIKSPNSLAASYTLVLPADDGTADQVLTTDGSGNLSWVTSSNTITLAADSGSNDTYTTGQTLTFAGGTGIDTTVSDNQISIAIDATVTTLTGSQTLTNKTLTSPVLNTGVSGSAIKDEDNMASDSATHLATQQSIKAYVDAQVTAQDLDFQADSGGALGIDLDSEALTFTGGTGIDTSGSGNAVTFAIDSTVATLTGSQTLTNKTVDLGDNTLTGSLAEFNTALQGDSFVSLTGSETLTNKTLTAPKFADAGFIADANGNELILLQTTASAVNEIEITNAATGNAVQIASTGGDTNIDLKLSPKGSGVIDVATSRISNVTDPTQDQDAATKSYVDATANGLDVKDSVKLASAAALAACTYHNGNGTLTGDANGALSVDGVAVAVNDRILIKDQADAKQNGIYKVTATGGASAVFVLTRTPDADTAAELTGGTFFFAEAGSANADNGYVATHNGTPTFGSTDLTFSQFSGAGQISAGTGLTKTGNTINAIAGSGITVNANDIQISASYVGQNTITTLGTIATGTWNGTAIGNIYGGTGQTTYTTGDMLYASGSNTLGKLALGASGKILQSNGSNIAYGDIDGGTY